MVQLGKGALGAGEGAAPISRADNARYTRDLLQSLGRMALAHDQIVLAHLIEAASREAERLLRQAGAVEFTPARHARRDGG